MPKDRLDTNPTPPLRRSALCWLAAGACALSGAFALALSVRPLSSADLGYHLAYGEVFLQTGQVVQDDHFIHPTIEAGRSPLPPGAWYDSAGRYHFPNANWLTQVIFAILHRLGGWLALNVLSVGLLAVILASQAGMLRRLGAGWGWVAPVWLATGLISYERFELRPELLGYACLMVQLWLLAGPIRWPAVAGLVGVQLLAPNVHSYWLLGLAVTGCFAAESAVRAFWVKSIVVRRLDEQLRSRLICLGVALVVMLPLPVIHPAGLRNLTMPLQTLTFLRENHISSSSPEEVSQRWQTGELHPWAVIGEFYTPFTPKLMATRPGITHIVLLSLACPAGLILLINRRWALAAVLAGMVFVSLSMRRNIAAAGMVGWPAVALSFCIAWRWAAGRWRGLKKPALFGQAVALSLVAFISSAWLLAIMTQAFYLNERREWRFGVGLSSLTLPLETARWLDEHMPADQPVFSDYNISSNLLYFSSRVSAVPVLTNTWAYPPERMETVLAITGGWPKGDSGQWSIDPTARQWGMDVVVLQIRPETMPLASGLMSSPNWTMVHLAPNFATFARHTPANAAMVAEAVTSVSLDVNAFMAASLQADPQAPVFGLRSGAITLHTLGWMDQAEPVWREVLRLEPGLHEAWLNLGVTLAMRADRLHEAGQSGSALRLLDEAIGCFRRAMELKPNYAEAKLNLSIAENSLDIRSRRNRLLKPIEN